MSEVRILPGATIIYDLRGNMKWHTETRKISELKNWESNPRNISEESFDELVSSVDELGNFDTLTIDIDGTVISGNQRLRVAKQLGEQEIGVSVPERKLTEDEIKKIGLISNRHSGEWDMDSLYNEFNDVLEELGFDDLMEKTPSEENRQSRIIVNCSDWNEVDKIETYLIGEGITNYKIKK